MTPPLKYLTNRLGLTLMGLCLILHTNKPAATHALPTWRSNAWLMQSSFNFWDHILGLRLFWEGSVNLFCEVYPQDDDILYGEYLPCDETASLVKIADKQSKLSIICHLRSCATWICTQKTKAAFIILVLGSSAWGHHAPSRHCASQVALLMLLKRLKWGNAWWWCVQFQEG